MRLADTLDRVGRIDDALRIYSDMATGRLGAIPNQPIKARLLLSRPLMSHRVDHEVEAHPVCLAGILLRIARKIHPLPRALPTALRCSSPQKSSTCRNPPRNRYSRNLSASSLTRTEPTIRYVCFHKDAATAATPDHLSAAFQNYGNVYQKDEGKI